MTAEIVISATLTGQSKDLKCRAARGDGEEEADGKIKKRKKGTHGAGVKDRAD